MKILEYSLIFAYNQDTFEKLINEKLQVGWSLYGDFQLIGCHYRQAMILVEGQQILDIPTGRRIRVE